MNKRELNRARVLVADDHPLIPRETERLLAGTFEVIGAVADGIEMVSAAFKLCPDIVVTDMGMPKMNGIEASRQILSRDRRLPIVLLTMHTEPALVREALQAGIKGYVVKSTDGEELVPAVHAVLAGKFFISPLIHIN